MQIIHGYIDLARIKARLGIADTNDDAALIDVVNSVCRWVDVHCRRRFYISDIDETRYFTPITSAYCRIDDMATVTSIATDSGDRTFGTAWSASDHHLVAQSTEMPGLPMIGLRVADNGRYRFEPRYYNSVRVVGKFGFAANSEALEIGEWVIAIGNPFGLNHTVTAGIVSAKGRRDVPPGHEANHARFIQTDASINPGNSGGPLINIRGEVVGINTAINAAGQGIGFAVPIDMVKTVLPQLAKGRVNRSYLGVQVGPIDKEIARKLGLDGLHGALVTDVKPSTPAEKGGLTKGDIIMTFDGKPIDRWDDLPWLASTAGAARMVKVQVNREGKPRELAVELVPYPEEQPVAGRTVEGLGLTVTAVEADKAKSVGLDAGDGVIVEKLVGNGPAAAAGLKVGDLIIQVNYQTVGGGPAGFAKLVEGVPGDQPLALTVRRGDRFLFKVFGR